MCLTCWKARCWRLAVLFIRRRSVARDVTVESPLAGVGFKTHEDEESVGKARVFILSRACLSTVDTFEVKWRRQTNTSVAEPWNTIRDSCLRCRYDNVEFWIGFTCVWAHLTAEHWEIMSQMLSWLRNILIYLYVYIWTTSPSWLYQYWLQFGICNYTNADNHISNECYELQ